MAREVIRTVSTVSLCGQKKPLKRLSHFFSPGVTGLKPVLMRGRANAPADALNPVNPVYLFQQLSQNLQRLSHFLISIEEMR
jgi:hypothetical protein